MAPSNQKRVKGIQIHRPFIYGTIAKPFDPVTNPKPPHVNPEHTHSWTVFVKGVADADITYWLRKVQFKLHESIPNPLRTVEAVPGKPFEVHETGWGEFEIQIKLHYVPESNEKVQVVWHHLRLHPYGNDKEREIMASLPSKEVTSMAYEEQLFNEPYEGFYEILTSGAPATGGKKGKGKGKSQADMVKGERNAVIPLRESPGNPYSREAELREIRKLQRAKEKVEEMEKEIREENKKKVALLNSLNEVRV